MIKNSKQTNKRNPGTEKGRKNTVSKILVNTLGLFFPLEISKLYLKIEVKIIVLSIWLQMITIFKIIVNGDSKGTKREVSFLYFIQTGKMTPVILCSQVINV